MKPSFNLQKSTQENLSGWEIFRRSIALKPSKSKEIYWESSRCSYETEAYFILIYISSSKTIFPQNIFFVSGKMNNGNIESKWRDRKKSESLLE